MVQHTFCHNVQLTDCSLHKVRHDCWLGASFSGLIFSLPRLPPAAVLSVVLKVLFSKSSRSFSCSQHVPALTHTLTADRVSRLEKYIHRYMAALSGRFIIIARSVIRPYRHSSTLKLRQFLCCLYIAAVKIIPSDYLLFLCLLLMLFYMGII